MTTIEAIIVRKSLFCSLYSCGKSIYLVEGGKKTFLLDDKGM